mmetsp:Transcript_12909/g.17336  ORF Transcript_12909/g.17336 Transcript_12909/m.17336 type:complete len:212 (-) Transcript_12909:706-1341(-)
MRVSCSHTRRNKWCTITGWGGIRRRSSRRLRRICSCRLRGIISSRRLRRICSRRLRSIISSGGLGRVRSRRWCRRSVSHSNFRDYRSCSNSRGWILFWGLGRSWILFWGLRRSWILAPCHCFHSYQISSQYDYLAHLLFILSNSQRKRTRKVSLVNILGTTEILGCHKAIHRCFKSAHILVFTFFIMGENSDKERQIQFTTAKSAEINDSF